MSEKTARNSRHKRDSKSFYSTLLLSFLVTAVASTIILAVFLTVAYSKTGIENTSKYNQKLLSQSNYAVDQMNENVEKLSVTLLTNQRIQAFMGLYSQKDAQTIPTQASAEIDKLLMALPYVEGIYLYNSRVNLVYSSINGYQQSLEEFSNEDVKSHLSDEKFLTEYDGSPILSTGEHGKKEPVFSYYILDHYVQDTDQRNAIVLNIYASTLTDSIRSMKKRSDNTDSSFAVLDRDKNYLTGVLDSELSNTKWLKAVQDTICDEELTGSSFLRIDGKRYFQTYTKDNVNGWYLVNFMPTHLFFKKFISTALLGCVLLIVVLGFAFAGCVYFSDKLNNPVTSITKMLTKQGVSVPAQSSVPKEFQMILSGLSSLSESNQNLRTQQQKTKYSLIQSCIGNLVTNVKTDSPELLNQKLEHLGLTYLKDKRLCMALLKVDRYQEFLAIHEPDELWALRFSVVNITEEIMSAVCSGNTASLDDDKFVLLINCESVKDKSHIEKTLTKAFLSVQENIEKFLGFTVTITYSTGFSGLDSLSAVYKNLESALKLKMRCGHNALITPYQAEEENDEAFNLSARVLYPFIDKLADGQFEDAWTLYGKLTQNLSLCNYDEITFTMIHLIYSVYERLTEKLPMLKDALTSQLREALSCLEHAETWEDIEFFFRHLCIVTCDAVQKLKEDPANQNTSVTVQKIVQIVESEYTNPALCLTSIADKIGLSQNYTGHLFKQVMQKSVAQYILDVRMEKLAYYLQNTDWPVNKILDTIGMEKNNYFYTRFKKHFGMSLSEYRAQFQCDSANEI